MQLRLRDTTMRIQIQLKLQETDETVRRELDPLESYQQDA
jgi:hypothetical protein